MDQIAAGTAPGHPATKVMTPQDPETGAHFTTEEMVARGARSFSMQPMTRARWPVVIPPEFKGLQK